MTTPTPSNEAVEAAIIYFHVDRAWESLKAEHIAILKTFLGEDDGFDVGCARILAAEVERLRGELKALKTDIRMVQEGMK